MRRSSSIRSLCYLLAIVAVAGFLYKTRYDDLWYFHYCNIKHRCVPLHKHVSFEVDFYGNKYRGNSDNLIDNHILTAGAYEKPILYFMRDVILARAPEKDGVAMDIGASTGQHSIFISSYASSVHAFEPWEPVVKRFQEMIKINNLENISLYPLGLGNENTVKVFFAPKGGNLSTGSFVADWKGENEESDSLPIVVGDEIFEKNPIERLDIIKIDIEGYEKLALEGLAKTLQQHRPIVVMELNTEPDVSFKSREDLIKTYPENYKFYQFGGHSLQDLYTGAYSLVDFTHSFDSSDQRTLVAYPAEFEAKLPKASAGKLLIVEIIDFSPIVLDNGFALYF